MTASRKPKTPSMTMLVRSGVANEDVDTFCKKGGRLTLSQVVDKVTVKETLVAKGSTRSKDFTVELSFYPASEYTAEYGVEPSEVLSAFGTKFALHLKKEIQNELRKFDLDMKSQMANVGRGKVVRERAGGEDAGEGDDEDEGDSAGKRRDDDEESEIGDGDATAAKRQRQTKEQASYEEDDSEGDGDENTAMRDEEIEAAYASDHGSEEDESPIDSEDLAEQVEIVEQMFLEHFPQARAFTFRDSGCTIDLQVSHLRISPGPSLTAVVVQFGHA